MPIKEALYVPSKKRHFRKLEQLENLKVYQNRKLPAKEIAKEMNLPNNYVSYLIREQKKHQQDLTMKEYVQSLLRNQFSFEQLQEAMNLTPLKLTFFLLFYDVEKDLFNEHFSVSAVLHEYRDENNVREQGKRMDVHFSTIKNIVALSKLEEALDEWDVENDETVFHYKEKIQLEKPYFFSKVEEIYFQSIVRRMIVDFQCGYQRVQRIFGFNSTDAETLIDYCLRDETVEVNRNWRYPKALIDKILIDYKDGMSNRAIEDKYGITRNQFKGIRSHYGFNCSKPKK